MGLRSKGLLVACCLLAAGCATEKVVEPPDPSIIDPSEIAATETEIVSDPPGARIELDDEYLGNTPLKVLLPFHDASTLRALPTEKGHCVQQKLLNGGHKARIYFNMSLCKALPPSK
jgi:hypothetical protein